MLLRYLLRYMGHQRWIRFGIRDRLIRAFHNPDTSHSESFKISFFGKIYPGNFSILIDWNTYYYGAYSREELSLIHDALKKIDSPIMLDIGANIGHHSLFASTIANKVHAFEPFPAVTAKLYEKIRVNSISNIIVHEVGFGETDANLPYSPPMDNNMGNGSFLNASRESPTSISLPIRRGDEYLKLCHLPKIDFIKMNIEGFELQALRGLQKSLQHYRPVVFFKWTGNKRKIDIDLEHLFPSQYKLFNFVSNRVILGVFSKAGYRLESASHTHYDGNKLAIPYEKMDLFSTKIACN